MAHQQDAHDNLCFDRGLARDGDRLAPTPLGSMTLLRGLDVHLGCPTEKPRQQTHRIGSALHRTPPMPENVHAYDNEDRDDPPDGDRYTDRACNEATDRVHHQHATPSHRWTEHTLKRCRGNLSRARGLRLMETTGCAAAER